MTFIEAALEVLRAEGRPMRAKDIADRAAQKGLLSHVGKTPEKTMADLLSTAVAKAGDKGPFIRVRPGVFGLAGWGDRAPMPAPKKEPKSEPKSEPKPAPKSEPRPEQAPASQAVEPKKKKRRRKKRAADPEARPSILPASEGTPSIVPPAEVKPSMPPPPPARPAALPDKPERPALKAPPGQEHAAAAELADQVEALLRSQTRPVPAESIASDCGIGGEDGAALLAASLVADGLERESRGLRPRFIRHRSGFALAERAVMAEILAIENKVAESGDRLTRIAEKQLLRRLRALKLQAFVQVMVAYLQRSGFGAMRPVGRGRAGEFHLSVQDRRRGGRFRTAVVLMRETVTEHAVMDLRGALHRYDATSGLIATDGGVSEEAATEALVPNLPPVAVQGGEAIAREMVRLGLGVRDRIVRLPAFDEGFFSLFEG